MSDIETLMWRVYGYVRERGVPVHEGGASVAQALYLRELARMSKSRVVAEIGFNVGFSSLAFLESSPDARVVSFELDNRRSVELAKEFIDANYPGRHDLVVGNSVETLPRYLETMREAADLVFIDGGHDYEVAAADTRNARRIAKAGAIVVTDDLIPWYPWGVGPYQAWQEAVDLGLIEPVEYYVDGVAVAEVTEPGDRAWGVGRFLGDPTA